MADFLFEALVLPDAYLISHFYAGDSRGSFAKTRLCHENCKKNLKKVRNIKGFPCFFCIRML